MFVDIELAHGSARSGGLCVSIPVVDPLYPTRNLVAAKESATVLWALL